MMAAMVPHGCMIRARFDTNTESFLHQLSQQIQTNVSQFVAQESAEVGLSSRKPFHITILEMSPMLNVPYVMATVNEIASRTSRLVGKVLPFCQVCENGEVRIRVNCPDIVLLGHELILSLPGSNSWFSQTNDSLFITIGVFHGAHRFDFETWLNKELSTNSELFPTFYSDFLSFSDEWLYVAHAHDQAVQLMGVASSVAAAAAAAPLADGKALDGLEPMHGSDIEGLLDSFTLSAEEAAIANVGSAADAEDAGAGNKQKKSHKGQKREPAAQKQQKPDQGGAAVEAEIVEEALAANLPSVVVPYQATTPPPGGSVWASANAAGKVAPPSVILAMRERATGGTAAHAAKKAALSAPARTASSAAAAVSSAKPGPSEKPQDESHGHGKHAHAGDSEGHHSAGGSSGGPNWVCPSCKVIVYGRRVMCFKCKTAKPANAVPGAAGAAPAASASSPRGGAGAAGASATGTAHMYPRKPKDGDVRDGDWICASCKGHNFASKIACFTCRSPRPPGYVIDPTPESAGEARDRKPGDWTCPKCNENVFAKRNRCYKCSTSKPKSMAAAVEAA